VAEIIKVSLAVAVFGVVHSLLASLKAKRFAAQLLGEDRQGGFYRLFYNVQALITFGLVLGYIGRLPARRLYHVRGPFALLMRAGQGLGLVHACWAAYQVGIARITGLSNLSAWWQGSPALPGPVAQGPEMKRDSELSIGGPFRWSRHPLNFSPFVIFWLTPHMTTRRLALNLVSSLYLILGSVHEEKRLRAVYGGAYEAYQRSGAPFYWPALTPRPPLPMKRMGEGEWPSPWPSPNDK
jgi:protein-S-isoprenylcysteine O-methyltransferase Ste14